MTAFEKIAALSTPESRKYTSKTLDIVDHIHSILERKGMSQKDLAELLGKQPSEVSRWMTGLHNFEMKTLVKIEVALGEEVILVNDAAQAKANEIAGILRELTPELQSEALSFIQYLRQKNNEKPLEIPSENPITTKRPKPYSKQTTVEANMLMEDVSVKYKKRKIG
jgi:transcriptional regulator with XRE-family HTH domain